MKKLLLFLFLAGAVFAASSAPMVQEAPKVSRTVRMLASDAFESLPLGSELILEVAGDGIPAPTFEWFLNGNKVGEGPLLTMPKLTASQYGTYHAMATNQAGSARSNNVIVTLGTPPTFATVTVKSKRPPDTVLNIVAPVGTKVNVTRP
jgi:hypothetical protein